MADRIEALKNLLEQDPNNSRMRYMLATEFVNAGKLAEAVAEYQALLAIDPNYVAGYFQAGRTSEKAGAMEAAKTFYQQGIDTARRTGDTHALSELEGALSLLD